MYCYKKGDMSVFLDRNDKPIKFFNEHKTAVEYAENNIHLINRNALFSKPYKPSCIGLFKYIYFGRG